MKPTRGFSLMELMITMAIVFILIAIAVPSYKNTRMLANEVAARASIRTVHAVQIQHQMRYNRFAANLSELGPQSSALLNDNLVTGRKDGYVFDLAAAQEGYTVKGKPEIYKTTGRVSFYSTQEQVIHETDGPEPPTGKLP